MEYAIVNDATHQIHNLVEGNRPQDIEAAAEAAATQAAQKARDAVIQKMSVTPPEGFTAVPVPDDENWAEGGTWTDQGGYAAPPPPPTPPRDVMAEAKALALKLKIAVPNSAGHSYPETDQGLADATQHFTQRSAQLSIKLTRGTITPEEDAELQRIEDGLAYWQFIDSVTPVIGSDENAPDPISDDARWVQFPSV